MVENKREREGHWKKIKEDRIGDSNSEGIKKGVRNKVTGRKSN